MERELIYVADPMCSWCWGFAPVIAAVADGLRGRASLRVLPGGLRTGSSMPLHEREVAAIMHEWSKIAAQTGQPFDFGQPLDTSYVYDTEPACRAVSLMQHERPLSGLEYLHSLQQAFYVGRRDLKDPEVLAQYARTFGYTPQDFIARLESDTAREAWSEDRRLVQQLGVEGFPSVLLRTDRRVQRLTVGYQPLEALRPHLARWLEDPAPT